MSGDPTPAAEGATPLTKYQLHVKLSTLEPFLAPFDSDPNETGAVYLAADVDRALTAAAHPIGRWRTFGTTRCPRTFPEIPMVAMRESKSGHGCDCWDCVEIRTERERDRFKAEAREARETNDELNTEVAALRGQVAEAQQQRDAWRKAADAAATAYERLKTEMVRLVRQEPN